MGGQKGFPDRRADYSTRVFVNSLDHGVLLCWLTMIITAVNTSRPTMPLPLPPT